MLDSVNLPFTITGHKYVDGNICSIIITTNRPASNDDLDKHNECNMNLKRNEIIFVMESRLLCEH